MRDTVKSPYFQNQDSSQTKLKDRLKSEARSDPYHDVEEIEDDGPLPYSLRNGPTTRKRAQVTSSHLSPDADSQSIRITNVAGLGLFGGGQHNSAISKEVDPPVKTYAITFAHSQHHTIGDEEDVSQDDKQEGAGTEAALKKKDLLYHPTGKAFYFYVNGKYASDDGYGIEGYTSFCINPDTATQTVVSKNKTDNKLIVRRKEGDLLLKLQSQLPVSFASDIRNRNPEIAIRQVSK